MAPRLLDEVPAHMLAPIARRRDREARDCSGGVLPADALAGFFGGHRFLSNFWLAPVAMHGETYPSVEHAYQAAKATSAADRRAIRLARTPSAAKRLGRGIAIRPDWEAVKVHVMLVLVLVRRKFCAPGLAGQLLATGSAPLFEDTTRWNDRVWGVVRRGSGYAGGNRLGRILEYVRAELRMTGRA